jgi:hypothetical protein
VLHAPVILFNDVVQVLTAPTMPEIWRAAVAA